MNRTLLNTKTCLFALLLGISSSLRAQHDDFTTWTKFKVNHKIDSRFSVSGDVELRTKDDMNEWDRLGLTLGGTYRSCSFLNLGIGYETHFRHLSHSDWKLWHRYHVSAVASFRYQWLKVSLRERLQQTVGNGDSETCLRSRLKLAYTPAKRIVSPYFAIEIYQNLGAASFWKTERMRYYSGVEIALAKRWSLDVFYCYQYTSSQGKHIAGIEVGYTF
ncbi:DUF2490 domain-containing protein [uncultured Bacteroides sp.]|uniref:DUF2490 domain-containing protein n=1 Tax=uncultured Bacteroides sp. TaxID=162156 RepID=UPI0025E62D70|nr:DUF2490 domain-containing protein [uncultured Bacteroides sp.]